MLDNVLENFEKKCHLLNDILFEKKLFLRVYELRTKIRYLFKKGHEKNELLKEISSCVEQRFNGFHIICHELDKKQKRDIESIDIIYKSVKNIKENIFYKRN